MIVELPQKCLNQLNVLFSRTHFYVYLWFNPICLEAVMKRPE